MVMYGKKRVVTALCAGMLLMSTVSTYPTQDSTASQIARGCAIGAGVLGLIGAVTAGICYLCSKSNEQVLEDAQNSLRMAHEQGLRFKSLYLNVFERAYYSEPFLDDVEINFLVPVALNALQSRCSMETYIHTLTKNRTTLHDTLTEIRNRIQKLETEYQQYSSIYHSLNKVATQIEQELNYLDPYATQLTKHAGFFALYEYEAQMCNTYNYELEIGRQYQYDPYLFELYIMQGIGRHNLHSEYPVLTYHARLTEHIDILKRHIHKLLYHYPSRTPLANQLLTYLSSLRGIVEVTPTFKEEKRAKKEADDRAEWLAYQARQTAALEANAWARQVEADAQQARARAERERNRIEREKYGIAPHNNTTVSVTFGL